MDSIETAEGMSGTLAYRQFQVYPGFPSTCEGVITILAVLNMNALKVLTLTACMGIVQN